MTADFPPDFHQNRLLNMLPQQDQRRLLPQLEPVDLTVKQVLAEPYRPIPFVYFPLSGVISLVLDVEDSGIVEVATVGNEGLAGLPVLLGATTSTVRTLCQVPGRALRIPSARFRDLVQQDAPLRDLLGRYTQALFDQMAQTEACNRLHPIEQRCARWLLMTHDRVDNDQFPLTQEFLAQMLGVRRPSVSVVASLLQRAGFIRYSRGIITITDRDGLEAAACPCYAQVRDAYDRLLGEAPAAE